jgi:hypothetical protein
LRANPTVSHLQTLHEDATEALGAGNPMTLEVETYLNVGRDSARPAAQALAAWADLGERASQYLATFDPLMMNIRSQFLRCLARRGAPGDLDQVVTKRDEEMRCRFAADAGGDWVGVARADLAVAQLQRARYSSLDPDVVDPDPDRDLAEAAETISVEIERRRAEHGADHAFTWRAAGVFGSIVAAQAGRTDEYPLREQLAEQALRVADGLVQHEWRRHGEHTLQALRGQLVRAQALSTQGRHREAVCEARLASVLARRYRRVDEGHALVVLARTEAAFDLRSALSSATRALTARREWYPEQGHQVAEARRLVETLTVVEPDLLADAEPHPLTTAEPHPVMAG